MPGDQLFDPLHQHYAAWPTSSKPQIQAWSSNQPVGYAQGVLHFLCGQACTPAAVPGPWNFDVPTVVAVCNLQGFFGYPMTGVVDQPTWGLIDYVWALHQ